MTKVVHHDFRAWNCDMSVELIEPTGDPEVIFQAVENSLKKYETKFSRFKKDSLISQLNDGKIVSADPDLVHLLNEAEKSTIITDGLFNPHVDLSLHGYAQSFVPDQFHTPTPRQTPTIRFPEGILKIYQGLQLKTGVSLDFGGFLKGWLAAHLADQFKDQAQGLIINLGGDLATRGQDVDQDEFEFYITNPITQQDEICRLQNGSLSTSGSYKRVWQTPDGEKSHLLNPHTNDSPTSDFCSISFWGADGGLTDSLATTAFMTQPQVWDEWCQKSVNLHYLAIKKDGSILTNKS